LGRCRRKSLRRHFEQTNLPLAAERCQNPAHSVSCGFPAPSPSSPGRGDRLHRLLPPHPGLVHFSITTRRLTPRATFCRASGQPAQATGKSPLPERILGVSARFASWTAAALCRFFATPRQFKAKRPPTPRDRPKRQLRSAPQPHSKTLSRSPEHRFFSRVAASERSPKREPWVARAHPAPATGKSPPRGFPPALPPRQRLGVRAACRRFFATPRRSEAKRPPTPSGRPKRQLRSAPQPHSRTLSRSPEHRFFSRGVPPIQLPASAGCGAGGKVSPCGLPLPGTNLPGRPRTAFRAVSGPQSLSANFSDIPSVRKSRLGTPPWSSCA
jgi:hypothetical protein